MVCYSNLKCGFLAYCYRKNHRHRGSEKGTTWPSRSLRYCNVQVRIWGTKVWEAWANGRELEWSQVRSIGGVLVIIKFSGSSGIYIQIYVFTWRQIFQWKELKYLYLFSYVPINVRHSCRYLVMQTLPPRNCAWTLQGPLLMDPLQHESI